MKRCINGWTLLMALPLLAQTVLVQAAVCQDTLKQIQAFYDATPDTCPGSNGEPQAAYNCSGLIIRGAMRAEDTGGKAGDYYIWQSSPKAREQGTISASYLRSDINFKDLTVKGEKVTEYTSGLIATPPWLITDPAARSYVDCAFPADAWSYDRGDKGCGDNSKTAEVESTCDSMGVNGQNWASRYFEPNMSSNLPLAGGTSCSFDLRTTDGARSSDQFRQFLEARKSMQNVPNQDAAFNSYTEVRMTNPSNDELIPWAFFYSDPKGLDAARKNQADYKQQKGVEVPVIRIQYPQDKNGKATFSCDAGPATSPTTPETNAGGWGPNKSKQCSQYFEKVEWISRPDPSFPGSTDSVSLVPTACGREIGADQTDAAMAEMKRKATALPGGVEKWGDRDMTLRRQFICHLTLVENGLPVRYKEVINIEPKRSYVSHEQSLRDKCNTPYSDQVTEGWGPNNSKQCSQYVQSVKWVTRKFAEYGNEDIKSLEVTPTKCGRNINQNDPAALKAMMDEIKRKALADDEQGKVYWGAKDPAMSKQVACLAKLFRDKGTWNIESKRSNDLTAAEYEAKQCNPK